MRLHQLLLSSIFFILTFAVAHAQDGYQLSIKDMKFEELLDYLGEEFHIQFAYNSELSIDQTFTIDNHSSNIVDLLAPIWKEANLDCKHLSDTQILLRALRPISSTQQYDFDIVDDDGRPLEMVAVSIKGSTLGTYSDTEGRATLFLKESYDDVVQFDRLGYEAVQYELSKLSPQNQIQLTQSDLMIEEVVVKDRITPIRYNEEDGSIRLQNDQNISLASSIAGADIMRQVQLLPGLSAHDDLSAGLKIRGGDENQTLIMMDGIPIYNASHYYGIFSSINSSYISDVSLYKNNLPIEQGGRTSGMLDMNSIEGHQSNGVHGTLDINLLTSSLALQIPIDDQLSLSLSGRSTYRNVSESDLLDLILPDPNVRDGIENFTLISRERVLQSTPDFTFNDWNAKLNFRPSDKHQMDFNFYTSNDHLFDQYSNNFRARRQDEILTTYEEYLNTEDWKNLGASMNSHTQLSSSLLWHNTAYFTQYDNSALVDLSLSNNRDGGTNLFEAQSQQVNEVKDFGIKSYLDYKVSSQLSVTGGIDYRNHNTDLFLSGSNEQSLNLESAEQELSLFSSIRHIGINGWKINAGLRASYYTATAKPYFSPRINVSKKLTETLTAKSSIGRQYQFARELSFENVFGRTRTMWTLANNSNIPVGSSNNFMLGGTWKKDRWTFDIEGYYRQTQGAIEYAFTNPPFAEDGSINQDRSYEFYQGDGISKGIDFMLSYSSTPYTSWLGYTLSESTQSFDKILNGTTFPAQDDRRHQWKWVNEYKVKKWSFNANLIYSSGRPYTDISQLNANDNRTNQRPEDRIRRLPAYIRFDLGVNYAFDIGSNKASLGLSALNLLDRDNVNYVQYIFSVPSNRTNQNQSINTVIGTETELLERTINLNFSLKF